MYELVGLYPKLTNQRSFHVTSLTLRSPERSPERLRRKSASGIHRHSGLPGPLHGLDGDCGQDSLGVGGPGR